MPCAVPLDGDLCRLGCVLECVLWPLELPSLAAASAGCKDGSSILLLLPAGGEAVFDGVLGSVCSTGCTLLLNCLPSMRLY